MVRYPYMHGGNYQPYLKRFGIQRSDIIDFSVSLNPLGMPDVLKRCIKEHIDAFERYPSPNGEGLLEFVRQRFGIKRALLATNGAAEAIYLVTGITGIKSALLIEPSFYDYRRALMAGGVPVYSLPLETSNNFQIPFSRLKNMLTAGRLLFLSNPNNPTGRLIKKHKLIELIDSFPEVTFVVDEAFIGFTEGNGKESLAPFKRDNLIVIGSLTKYYGIPGLRAGYIVASKTIIDAISRRVAPWRINACIDSCIQSLLTAEDYEKETETLVSGERSRLARLLSRIDGIRLFPTDTNFFLAQWTKTENLDDLMVSLLKEGIFVRDCRNFRHLKGNFFRFAIRKKEENNLLIKALKKACMQA